MAYLGPNVCQMDVFITKSLKINILDMEKKEQLMYIVLGVGLWSNLLQYETWYPSNNIHNITIMAKFTRAP